MDYSEDELRQRGRDIYERYSAAQREESEATTTYASTRSPYPGAPTLVLVNFDTSSKPYYYWFPEAQANSLYAGAKLKVTPPSGTTVVTGLITVEAPPGIRAKRVTGIVSYGDERSGKTWGTRATAAYDEFRKQYGFNKFGSNKDNRIVFDDPITCKGDDQIDALSWLHPALRPKGKRPITDSFLNEALNKAFAFQPTAQENIVSNTLKLETITFLTGFGLANMPVKSLTDDQLFDVVEKASKELDRLKGLQKDNESKKLVERIKQLAKDIDAVVALIDER